MTGFAWFRQTKIFRRVTEDLSNGRKQRTRHRRVAVPDDLAVAFDRAARSNRPMRDLLLDRGVREELGRLENARRHAQRQEAGADGKEGFASGSDRGPRPSASAIHQRWATFKMSGSFYRGGWAWLSGTVGETVDINSPQNDSGGPSRGRKAD